MPEIPEVPSNERNNPLSNLSDEPYEDNIGGEEEGAGAFGKDTDEGGGVGALDDEHNEVEEAIAEIRVKSRGLELNV